MSINALVRHPGRLPEEQESRANVALRPLSLDEFLGQEGLKKNLNIFIEAAKARGGAIDHILLYGPPGLGKTTLAKIISKEMGVNFLPTSGPIIHKAGDLAAILTKLSEGDILFIDEIHRLNITIEEILYPAMEDFKLDLMIGEGAAARSIRIDLPQFTLIGATTRSGLVSSPLRDRFGIQLRLDLYSIDELKKVINRACKLREIEIDEAGTTEIAKRSRGTPRIAGRLLRRVHDLALVMGQRLINKEISMKSLEMLDIDINGLDSMDQKYLRTILDFYEGGPVGIETLASSLNEQKDTLEDVVEPYLLQQGFIQRTPRGRVLTAIAYDYLKGKK